MSVGDSPKRVAAKLQAHIQEAQLKPGDRLGREDELAAELGTSRIVLREALRTLSTTHLVRTSRGPGGGVFVADTFEGGIARMVSQSVAELLDAQVITAADLMEARIAIEGPLAAVAADTHDDALDDTLASIVGMAQSDPSDHGVIGTTGAAFHRAIAQAGGNRLVGAITAWIFDVLQPELERLQGRHADEKLLVAQHDDIRAAIDAHDPQAAQQAMSEHLRYLAKAAGILP